AGAALALVLVNPGVGTSTSTIYGGVTPAMYSDGSHVRQMVAALRSRRPARIAASLYNALERVAAPAHRQVAQMEAALLAAGALGAAMSGSGLTVFGVARSFDHARQIRAPPPGTTAVLPSYGYGRQGRKVEPRVPISATLVADLREAAGIDRVLALDLHAGQMQGFFRVPVDHLFAAPIISDYLGKKELR